MTKSPPSAPQHAMMWRKAPRTDPSSIFTAFATLLANGSILAVPRGLRHPKLTGQVGMRCHLRVPDR